MSAANSSNTQNAEASPPPVDESLLRQALAHATHHLEHARCQQVELEAWTALASTLLKLPPGQQQQVDLSASLPTGGLKDGWTVLTEITAEGLKSTAAVPETTSSGGQWATTVHRTLQAASIQSMAKQASSIATDRLLEGGPALKQAMENLAQVAATTNGTNDPNQWLQVFDERLSSLRAYHARHHPVAEVPLQFVNNSKRPRLGNPAADGYDLHAAVQQHLQSLQNETLYSPPEVLGKYLDLLALYEQSKDWFFDSLSKRHSQQQASYVDFLQVLSSGLDQAWDETTKLQTIRKPYATFLSQLQSYLRDFIQRTAPLLDIQKQIEDPAWQTINEVWSQVGGNPPAWQAKPVEAILAQESSLHEHNNNNNNPKAPTIDLSQYDTVKGLEHAVDGDKLKAELARLGLKCGGTVQARAERLFLLKSTALKDLAAKHFAKTTSHTSGNVNHQQTAAIRRIDLARRETVVLALLHQVQPILEATVRKSERQLTQTLAEREREYFEELYGSGETLKEKNAGANGKNNGDDESDDDDAPIYNPKNVPLDWDGKPIPYWLFKLHGLNHYYACEICGGESYRGRRNFELHFAEQKHAMGMKSLGIPNTKHFHGVTTIDDAQLLWSTLQHKVEEGHFDGSQEEEYEDSHGNVLSRSTYEDLARQGLL